MEETKRKLVEAQEDDRTVLNRQLLHNKRRKQATDAALNLLRNVSDGD